MSFSRTTRDLSIDYQGRQRPKTEHGTLAFGENRNVGFRATNQERKVAYDDWADRMRFAVQAIRQPR